MAIQKKFTSPPGLFDNPISSPFQQNFGASDVPQADKSGVREKVVSIGDPSSPVYGFGQGGDTTLLPDLEGGSGTRNVSLQPIGDRPSFTPTIPGALQGGELTEAWLDIDPITRQGIGQTILNEEEATRIREEAALAADVTAAEFQQSPGFANAMEGYDQADAGWASLNEGLGVRGSDSYNAISDMMMTPSFNQAFAAGAQGQQAARDQMASRGLGRSGASATQQAGIGAQAGMAMAGLRAGQQQGNVDARERANAMLAQGLAGRSSASLGAAGLESAHAGGVAALENYAESVRLGQEFMDPMAIPTYLESLRQAGLDRNALAEFRNRQMELDAQLAQPGPGDWLASAGQMFPPGSMYGPALAAGGGLLNMFQPRGGGGFGWEQPDSGGGWNSNITGQGGWF